MRKFFRKHRYGDYERDVLDDIHQDAPKPVSKDDTDAMLEAFFKAVKVQKTLETLFEDYHIDNEIPIGLPEEDFDKLSNDFDIRNLRCDLEDEVLLGHIDEDEAMQILEYERRWVKDARSLYLDSRM